MSFSQIAIMNDIGGEHAAEMNVAFIQHFAAGDVKSQSTAM